MSTINPYQAPVFSSQPPVPRESQDGSVPAGVMIALRATRPWVNFLAILGFVGAGLLGLAGLVIAVAGSMTEKAKLPSTMGLAYALFGVLYFFPSLYLLRFGSAIRSLLHGGGVDALTEAMVRQKSFWRLVGISTLVIMSLYVVLLVGAAVIFATTIALHRPMSAP